MSLKSWAATTAQNTTTSDKQESFEFWVATSAGRHDCGAFQESRRF